MGWKRKMQGGVLGFIGFMLSPLSWWNDLFVNVPLAVAFGWLVSLVYRPAFEVAVIVGYWLTNVLGFVLMQKGAQRNRLQETLVVESVFEDRFAATWRRGPVARAGASPFTSVDRDTRSSQRDMYGFDVAYCTAGRISSR